jgi:hypothetical protein
MELQTRRLPILTLSASERTKHEELRVTPRKTADITQPDKFWLRSKSLLFSQGSLEGAFICALEAWLPMDI